MLNVKRKQKIEKFKMTKNTTATALSTEGVSDITDSNISSNLFDMVANAYLYCVHMLSNFFKIIYKFLIGLM